MEEAARLVARMLKVDLVSVGELLPGGNAVLVRAGVGWRPGVVGHETEAAGVDSLAGCCLLRAEPVVSDDLSAERRFGIAPYVSEHGAQSAAAVVNGNVQMPFGVLAAMSTRARHFAPDDVDVLQAVANMLATAAERSLGERRLHDAREAERRRIARQLHDEALRDLDIALAEVPQARHPQLAAVLARIGARLRCTIYDLQLTAKEQLPFRDGLEELAALYRTLAASAVQIELDVGDSVPNRPLGHRGTELLRIAGDALANAVRHSRARRVRLAAWGTDDALCVEVADDGRGFDAQAVRPSPGGTGLAAMRQLAAAIGAELTLRTRPAEGTRVTVVLPLASEPSAVREPIRVLLVEEH
ncbi:MAG: ATP-binding protein, partial [Ilumatobacteraceae bacterium]